ncbi:hypothetical protein PoB_005050500 [Plakobranchus ocellatus]|uniref:Uncharacterized protein n=1 Tax=Plakobranchus ocellatus TaxID=259542 RepID=A0AAV4BXW1_9GAST|nr:hypothetical protein PoB_005050500 [Plakobranchus ocellatus]
MLLSAISTPKIATAFRQQLFPEQKTKQASGHRERNSQDNTSPAVGTVASWKAQKPDITLLWTAYTQEQAPFNFHSRLSLYLPPALRPAGTVLSRVRALPRAPSPVLMQSSLL